MFIDITRKIHPEMVIYPNNPGVEFEQTQKAGVDTNSLTRIVLGSHTGTHIDTPAHIHEGDEGAFVYPLEQLIGEAQVVDVSTVRSVITKDDLTQTTSERVLFKTRNSDADVDTFDEGFVALDESAAQELVERGVKLVGIDALSIKKRGEKNKVHQILIDAGIVVLEGVWLAEVSAGEYELLCLPLKVDLDGAPVRAVLRTVS